MARQPIESLDEVEQGVEPATGGQSAKGRRPQLRQFFERTAGMPCPYVGKSLGQRIDVTRRHPQRHTDIANSVPHSIGLHHGHACGAFCPEPVEDPLVDLRPARGLHIDVDIGEFAAHG